MFNQLGDVDMGTVHTNRGFAQLPSYTSKHTKHLKQLMVMTHTCIEKKERGTLLTRHVTVSVCTESLEALSFKGYNMEDWSLHTEKEVGSI